VWPGLEWIFGASASAALGAGEAFKVAMAKLERFALNPDAFRTFFAPSGAVEVQLAPEGTAEISDLGAFDVISGGAIANALFYCLSRIRRARGAGRVFDADRGDLTNLNRNMMVTALGSRELKVSVLQRAFGGDLTLEGFPFAYDKITAMRVGKLAARVMSGVDDIPTRWLVQAQAPAWHGVGATSHWSALASFHTKEVACARCLHPTDDPTDAPIPTIAFVSFWAGLLLATYFLQSQSRANDSRFQQTFLTPLRPEILWRTPVARRLDCPLCAAPLMPTKLRAA
jgi:hypothetical protein